MAKRKIIWIDESLCDGCGLCVPACAEGAIQIIDGKARLVSETYCDGLGACLGECPKGALTIGERDAEEFTKTPEAPAFSGCPSARVVQLHQNVASPGRSPKHSAASPALSHWPVKLRLVPPTAPFLKEAHLILAADCVPFASADLHREFLPDHAVVIGCPKFDDHDFALSRLTAILQQNDIASLTVLHMEVPCCFGYARLAEEALAASGKNIPLRNIVIGIHGDFTDQAACAD